MELKILEPRTVQVETVLVIAGVRYWEDATVNGVEDTDGTLIPCRDGDNWCPHIDIKTGKILNWKIGVEADIHYKVGDDGSYFLQDSNAHTVASIEEDYVPNSLIPGDGGDYIIIKVSSDGVIENWSPSLSDFEKSDDE